MTPHLWIFAKIQNQTALGVLKARVFLRDRSKCSGTFLHFSLFFPLEVKVHRRRLSHSLLEGILLIKQWMR